MADRRPPQRPARPKPRAGPRAGPPRAGGKGPGREPRLGGGVRLIYEDDEIIVVDKPPGIVTAILPGEAGASPDVPSVFGEVKRYARAKRRGTGRVWVVHRLDKEASGLLVFATTERAFAWLKEDFRARRAHRLYLAVVENQFASDAMSGTLQGFVAEDAQGLMRVVPGRSTIGGRDDRGPQLAVTHYRVLAQGNEMALVQVRLRTGRKNQIRVQMSSAGHPLVGDWRYRPPGPPKDPIGRLCLHATELGFAHPSKGETMRFSSPAPREFWSIVGADPPREVPGDPGAPSGISVEDARARESIESAGSFPDRAPEEPGAGSPSAAQDRSADRGTLPGLGARTTESTSWDHVAAWYEELLDRGRSDHQRDVIVPGALRLLRAHSGARVLDVACGEGSLCRRLAAMGVEAVGVDASVRLIDAARRASPKNAGAGLRFEVGDARTIGALGLGTFDAAACIMALMNIDPIEPVLSGVAGVLRPGGAFVAVILHPAFRSPGQTSWGWDERRESGPPDRAGPRDRAGQQDRAGPRVRAGAREGAGPHERERAPLASARQYRRVDGYLSQGQTPIVMNPGHAAHGKPAVTTWTFHRPLQFYVRALAEAGFVIDALEEWPSLRRSEPGPRATEENRARREIPLFLGLRAVRR